MRSPEPSSSAATWCACCRRPLEVPEGGPVRRTASSTRPRAPARRAAAASSRSIRACSRTTRATAGAPRATARASSSPISTTSRAARKPPGPTPAADAGTCEACAGRRLKPEALAVRLHGESIAEVTARSVADAHVVVQEAEARGARTRDRARRRAGARQPARFPRSRRLGLSDARSCGADTVGRRSAAHQARGAARLQSARRLLHPRRADDRLAPARQRAAARYDREIGGEGQHGRRRRARRGDDSPRRARRRSRSRRGARRRRGHRQRLVARAARERALHHGPRARRAAAPSAARPPHRRARAPPTRRGSSSKASRATTCASSMSRCRWRGSSA